MSEIRNTRAVAGNCFVRPKFSRASPTMPMKMNGRLVMMLSAMVVAEGFATACMKTKATAPCISDSIAGRGEATRLIISNRELL